MSKTDHKRRKLAGVIGESFAAVRRRTARSTAWLSLSAPAIKLYIELRLRWRHKEGNNGELFISFDECERLLGIPRATAHRGFKELEAKGFIVKTRQGEAGRLTAAVLENGGFACSRRATTWRLTDEPYRSQPATYDYERWQPPEGRKKQNPRSTNGTSKVPLTERRKLRSFHQRNGRAP